MSSSVTDRPGPPSGQASEPPASARRASALQSAATVVSWHSFPANSTSGLTDYFNVLLRDRVLAKTEKVNGSRSTDFLETAISDDGRFVAFNDAGVAIRVRDRKTGALNEVSVNNKGESQNKLASGLSISADGRFIAFGSSAYNLVPGDTNETFDIFVRDRLTRTTERVSVAGQQLRGESVGPSISANGKFVAFVSDADNIVWDGSRAAARRLPARPRAGVRRKQRPPGRLRHEGPLAISGQPRLGEDRQRFACADRHRRSRRKLQG